MKLLLLSLFCVILYATPEGYVSEEAPAEELAVGSHTDVQMVPYEDEGALSKELELEILHDMRTYLINEGNFKEAERISIEIAATKSRRRRLAKSSGKKRRCKGNDNTCLKAFDKAVNRLLGKVKNDGTPYCKKPSNKRSRNTQNCCGRNQYLFVCADCFPTFWDGCNSGVMNCCGKFQASDGFCYDHSTCPGGYHTCSPWAQGKYCSHDTPTCVGHVVEGWLLVADIAANMAMMMFTGGAGNAAKAAVSAGAKAMVKAGTKAAARAAAKKAGKMIAKNLKSSLKKHFKKAAKELKKEIMDDIKDEALVVLMAEESQRSFGMTAAEVAELIDPTGVAALANYVNSHDECVYPPEVSDAEYASLEGTATNCGFEPEAACTGSSWEDLALNENDCIARCKSTSWCNCVTMDAKVTNMKIGWMTIPIPSFERCRLERGSSWTTRSGTSYSAITMSEANDCRRRELSDGRDEEDKEEMKKGRDFDKTPKTPEDVCKECLASYADYGCDYWEDYPDVSFLSDDCMDCGKKRVQVCADMKETQCVKENFEKLLGVRAVPQCKGVEDFNDDEACDCLSHLNPEILETFDCDIKNEAARSFNPVGKLKDCRETCAKPGFEAATATELTSSSSSYDKAHAMFLGVGLVGGAVAYKYTTTKEPSSHALLMDEEL